MPAASATARQRALLPSMAAAAALGYRERRDPSPCPFAQRWLLHVPRPEHPPATDLGRPRGRVDVDHPPDLGW